MPKDTLILYSIGIALLAHGLTLLIFLTTSNLTMSIGVLGKITVPINKFEGIPDLISYSWAATVIGVFFLVAGIVLHQLRKTQKAVV